MNLRSYQLTLTGKFFFTDKVLLRKVQIRDTEDRKGRLRGLAQATSFVKQVH